MRSSTSPFALAVVAAFAIATPAAAQVTAERPASEAAASPTPAAPRLRAMARFGIEDGGDKVLGFTYEEGSTPNVTAGGGLHVSLGAAYRAFQSRAGGLDAQLGLGLKWRTIPPATNQDANWLRFPVDAMLLFRSTHGFGIGAGATMHLANALRTSGAVANGRVDFDNSPGLLVQAEYAWKGVTFDLRYSGLEYTVADDTAQTVNASSVGVGITVLFGRKGIVR